MRRREFIAVLGGAATWSHAVRAQQAENPVRIGFLPIGSPSNSFDQSLVEAFRQGLRHVNLIENRNITLDTVWVAADSELSQAVSTLVLRGAKLLVTAGSSASVAAKHYTATIPIVFVPVGNPVGIGLVASLSHPGGNATGFSDVLADLSGKYVQFAIELAERQLPIHYLWHTDWSDGQHRLQATERAAKSLGAQLRPEGIRDIAESNDALAAMKKNGALAFIIQPSPFTYRHRVTLIDAAIRHGLATILPWPIGAREGGVIAYGPDYPDLYRRAAAYVERILKGTRPADLPVEEPTKFLLVINLKAAKTLGQLVPASVLATADEVIE
jgi:putative ABC transport system substrate-binding protein